MRTSILAVLCLAFSSFAFAQVAPQGQAEPEKKARVVAEPGVRCLKPQSPLYKPKDVNDALTLSLITDFKAAMNQDQFAETKTKAVIVAVNKKGQLEYSPVLLMQRGASRRKYCPVPPQRIMFVDPAIKTSIEKTLSENGLAAGSPEYLKAYYDRFLEISVDNAQLVNAKGEGVFAKLGDDVKLVTHCGKSKKWDKVGGDDEEKQDSKLYMEYYLYKILDQLEMMVEATRLANITYLDQDGSRIFDGPKLGFFREPPKSLAERCGLKTQRPPNAPGRSNETSHIQAVFINRFAINGDYQIFGHNMNNLYDDDGTVYFGPYDFDLSGVIIDGYLRNDSTWANLDQLVQFLSNRDPETAKKILDRLVPVRAKMQKVIDTSLMGEAEKTRFQTWFTMYMDRLKMYRDSLQ